MVKYGSINSSIFFPVEQTIQPKHQYYLLQYHKSSRADGDWGRHIENLISRSMR